MRTLLYYNFRSRDCITASTSKSTNEHTELIHKCHISNPRYPCLKSRVFSLSLSDCQKSNCRLINHDCLLIYCYAFNESTIITMITSTSTGYAERQKLFCSVTLTSNRDTYANIAFFSDHCVLQPIFSVLSIAHKYM